MPGAQTGVERCVSVPTLKLQNKCGHFVALEPGNSVSVEIQSLV